MKLIKGNLSEVDQEARRGATPLYVNYRKDCQLQTPDKGIFNRKQQSIKPQEGKKYRVSPARNPLTLQLRPVRKGHHPEL